MGNPNVGKSVIFSRLTGANVIASNYPGTTVDFLKGRMRLEGETIEIIDAPGTYSLEPTNKAEEVALNLLKEADMVINVVDATNLERNLYLTLQLIEEGYPVIVALNLWDEAKHIGIKIDKDKLEELLGVPVVPTVALTGEGIKQLVLRLKEVKRRKVKRRKYEERWAFIGDIIKEVELIEHRHHTLRDRLADITIKPHTGIPFAIVVLIVSFWFVRLVGENLINYIFDPLFELYKKPILWLYNAMGKSLLRDILIGQLIGGELNYMEAMGLLTTGIYVPFAAVLPYIISFYLLLSILEDSGYLPRLATLVDNVFHKLGMHGHGIVPLFLGLGCNVPGALSTRILETRKQRFVAATLLAISVPCMAQIAMIFGVLGRYGVFYISLVFLTLASLYIILGLMLNKFVKGESPEIFLEIPPYRRPSLLAITKKTWIRIRWFLQDAIPMLFIGVVIINALYFTGILDVMTHLFSPLTEKLFGLPGGATVALLAGFLRKDLAVGMLLSPSLNLTPYQLVIATTILAIYFPCVATFSLLLRELGLKDMLKSTLIMITTAILVGFLLKVLLLNSF